MTPVEQARELYCNASREDRNWWLALMVNEHPEIVIEAADMHVNYYLHPLALAENATRAGMAVAL